MGDFYETRLDTLEKKLNHLENMITRLVGILENHQNELSSLVKRLKNENL